MTERAPGRGVNRRFFARPPLELARDLIGCRLVGTTCGKRVSGTIVETEAYIGEEDRACHASAGRTKRTAVMYGPPGHLYVYLIYGMYHCLNIVADPEGSPAAILIRALEPEEGLGIMARRRGLAPSIAGASPRARAKLTSGPGRLCQALRIDRRLTGTSLWGGPLSIERRRARPAITITARVNIDYAGEWSRRPWRFVATGSPYVSGPRPVRSRG